MTTKEFWNLYDEDIPSNYEALATFLSKELPQDFLEECDPVDIILEVFGKLNDERNYEAASHFNNIIKKSNSVYYKQSSPFMDLNLIKYTCFQENEKLVWDACSNYLNDPMIDIDLFFQSFKTLCYYQQYDILDRLSRDHFEKIRDAENLLGAPEGELAQVQVYLALERFYEDGRKSLPRAPMLKILKKYSYYSETEYLLMLDAGFFLEQADKQFLEKSLVEKKNHCLFLLGCYFIKYMKARHFRFPLSDLIWARMAIFWMDSLGKKKPKFSTLFDIRSSKYEKLLENYSGTWLVDNMVETVCILWSGVYVYDFLLSIGLISEEIYQSFILISRKMKGRIIARNTSSLWEYDFVHRWQKPDGISEEEFEVESRIFRKSIEFKNQRFTRLRKYIAPELKQLGELGEFVIEGAASLKDPLETLMDRLGIDEDLNMKERKPIKPQIISASQKKPGRNEPCSCGSGKKYKRCCGK